MWIAVAGGAVLGIVSRIEEVGEGFDVGVSSNLTWLAVAFAVGALSAELDWGGLRGATALTAANAGYYAWVLTTEHSRPLDAVAGPVEEWFALGVTGGFVFGVAGASRRAVGWLPLAAIAVAESFDAPLLP